VQAFLGGGEQAEAYLEVHQKVHGNKIYVWHSNDLGNVPVARPLVLFSGYLYSYFSFFNGRRVPGVRRASVSEPVRAGGAPRKNISIENLIEDVNLSDKVKDYIQRNYK
ncbi:MAG TPA: hypothetical protein HA370_01990, partial [Nanoarchaeota archaeon]|nr:hypothetical protein [Nanoarchaeota archaeon]